MIIFITGWTIQYVDHTDHKLKTCCTDSKDEFIKGHPDDEIRSTVYWTKLAAVI